LPAALIVAVLLYYYLPPTVNLFQAKAYVKDKPELWQIPQPLALDRREAIDGKPLSYVGLGFSTPWGEPKLFRRGETVAGIQFHNTRSIIIFAYAEQTDSIRILRERDKNGETERIYGVSALKSNFDLKRAVLYTSPADLSFSLNRERMLRNCWFLISKSADVSNKRTGIYEFRTDKVRGFQMGDPAKSDAIVLFVFDRYDHESTIIVATVKNAPTRLTQSEVNTILLSLDSDGGGPAESLPGKSVASK
jgi:hypothetical protein